MGFEPTRAEHNGLAVHRLNHSATSSCDMTLYDTRVDNIVEAARVYPPLVSESVYQCEANQEEESHLGYHQYVGSIPLSKWYVAQSENRNLHRLLLNCFTVVIPLFIHRAFLDSANLPKWKFSCLTPQTVSK